MLVCVCACTCVYLCVLACTCTCVHAAPTVGRFGISAGPFSMLGLSRCSENRARPFILLVTVAAKHQLRFFITWSPLLEPLLSCLACQRLPTMLSRLDLVMFAMLFASSSLFAMLFPCSLDSAPTTGLRTPCKKKMNSKYFCK